MFDKIIKIATTVSRAVTAVVNLVGTVKLVQRIKDRIKESKTDSSSFYQENKRFINDAVKAALVSLPLLLPLLEANGVGAAIVMLVFLVAFLEEFLKYLKGYGHVTDS